MTLTEFLLARIDEDEAVAEEWPDKGEWGLHSPGLMWVDARGHPIWAPRQRVLAECEAKRRIIDEHRPESVPQYDPPGEPGTAQVCGRCGGSYVEMHPNCPTLRALASPYADHPDCRPEWVDDQDYLGELP